MQDSDGEGDGGYTLTAKGELSPADAFTLPPSPTQTLKHRYRVYRPKLARQATKSRVSGKSTTAGGAYRGAVDEVSTSSRPPHVAPSFDHASRSTQLCSALVPTRAALRSATSKHSCSATANLRGAGAMPPRTRTSPAPARAQVAARAPCAGRAAARSSAPAPACLHPCQRARRLFVARGPPRALMSSHLVLETVMVLQCAPYQCSTLTHISVIPLGERR